KKAAADDQLPTPRKFSDGKFESSAEFAMLSDCFRTNGSFYDPIVHKNFRRTRLDLRKFFFRPKFWHGFAGEFIQLLFLLRRKIGNDFHVNYHPKFLRAHAHLFRSSKLVPVAA